MAGRKLTVETGLWRVISAVNAFPFASLNKGKALLDVEVMALYDADADAVAPHGIFGQAYDGDELAVNGAIDKAQGGDMTTTAQGEGAIEGSLADYKLTGPFSTDFKYSRFNALFAPHRDVTKLSGVKIPRSQVENRRGSAHHAEVVEV